MATIKRPMYRLFKYLDNYRSNLIFASLSSIINKIFDLMPPILTGWLIDTLSKNPPGWTSYFLGDASTWTIIVWIIIFTLFVFGMESFFEWLYKRGFMRLAQKVQHQLRIEAYQKMQRKEMAFFENERTGNLIAMLNDDINQLERFLNNSFSEILHLITLVLFAGWTLCMASLELGLLGMAPIPFIILGSIYYQRKISPYYKDIRNSVGELSNRLENNISGIQIIKSFTAESFETQRVENASKNYKKANFLAIEWSAVYVPIIRIFITLGFASTLAIGSYWVLFEPDKFTLGGLAFFAMMIQRLLWPVTRLGVVFDEYERAKASARRVFGLVDSEPSINSPNQPTAFPSTLNQIQFQSISFGYQNDQSIINKLDLTVPAGSIVGIAGPTGGGKTTLIKLLLRFYDVDKGNIHFNEVSIKDLDLQELRSKIALVSQNTYLFYGTILENIAYGRPNSSLEAVIEAAKKAQLHDFIDSLPNKYETLVGEKGIKLSGGQQQRLSIARAIIKDAPILILDEATSAVDTETEKAIQQNINQLTENKTAFIIAHRLSTIRNADHIIVMKDGHITESGTHQELITRGEVYADLWNVQVGAIS